MEVEGPKIMGWKELINPCPCRCRTEEAVLHRSEVWALEEHLGPGGAATEQIPVYIFCLAFGCRSLGKPLLEKPDKGVPVVTHGNSLVQRNALKIGWNPVTQSQINKQGKPPVVLHQPWPKISIFLSLFNNQVPFSPSPPKEINHICSRLLEIKRTKTRMYGFLSFSYTEIQGHGNTRLRGLE